MKYTFIYTPDHEDGGFVAQCAEVPAAIERLASSKDIQVQNIVTVEIFENIDENDISNETFRAKLGPKALAIFLRWGRGLGNDGYGNPSYRILNESDEQ